MKNLKFKVQVTPEQSEKIQKGIFKKGGSWASGDAYVKYHSLPFLSIESGFMKAHDVEEHFIQLPYTQVPALDALCMVENSRPYTPYSVDIHGDVIAVRTTVSKKALSSNRPEITPLAEGVIRMWEMKPTIQYDVPPGFLTFKEEDSECPLTVTTLRLLQYKSVMKRAIEYCEKLNNQKGEDE